MIAWSDLAIVSRGDWVSSTNYDQLSIANTCQGGFFQTPLSDSPTLYFGNCDWEQHSRSPTACIWGGGSSMSNLTDTARQCVMCDTLTAKVKNSWRYQIDTSNFDCNKFTTKTVRLGYDEHSLRNLKPVDCDAVVQLFDERYPWRILLAHSVLS